MTDIGQIDEQIDAEEANINENNNTIAVASSSFRFPTFSSLIFYLDIFRDIIFTLLGMNESFLSSFSCCLNCHTKDEANRKRPTKRCQRMRRFLLCKRQKKPKDDEHALKEFTNINEPYQQVEEALDSGATFANISAAQFQDDGGGDSPDNTAASPVVKDARNEMIPNHGHGEEQFTEPWRQPDFLPASSPVYLPETSDLLPANYRDELGRIAEGMTQARVLFSFFKETFDLRDHPNRSSNASCNRKQFIKFIISEHRRRTRNKAILKPPADDETPWYAEPNGDYSQILARMQDIPPSAITEKVDQYIKAYQERVDIADDRVLFFLLKRMYQYLSVKQQSPPKPHETKAINTLRSNQIKIFKQLYMQRYSDQQQASEHMTYDEFEKAVSMNLNTELRQEYVSYKKYKLAGEQSADPKPPIVKTRGKSPSGARRVRRPSCPTPEDNERYMIFTNGPTVPGGNTNGSDHLEQARPRCTASRRNLRDYIKSVKRGLSRSKKVAPCSYDPVDRQSQLPISSDSSSDEDDVAGFFTQPKFEQFQNDAGVMQLSSEQGENITILDQPQSKTKLTMEPKPTPAPRTKLGKAGVGIRRVDIETPNIVTQPVETTPKKKKERRRRRKNGGQPENTVENAETAPQADDIVESANAEAGGVSRKEMEELEEEFSGCPRTIHWRKDHDVRTCSVCLANDKIGSVDEHLLLGHSYRYIMGEVREHRLQSHKPVEREELEGEYNIKLTNLGMLRLIVDGCITIPQENATQEDYMSSECFLFNKPSVVPKSTNVEAPIENATQDSNGAEGEKKESTKTGTPDEREGPRNVVKKETRPSKTCNNPSKVDDEPGNERGIPNWASSRYAWPDDDVDDENGDWAATASKWITQRAGQEKPAGSTWLAGTGARVGVDETWPVTDEERAGETDEEEARPPQRRGTPMKKCTAIRRRSQSALPPKTAPFKMPILFPNLHTVDDTVVPNPVASSDDVAETTKGGNDRRGRRQRKGLFENTALETVVEEGAPESTPEKAQMVPDGATFDYSRLVVEPGHGDRPNKKRLKEEIKEKVKTKGEPNKHLQKQKSEYDYSNVDFSPAATGEETDYGCFDHSNKAGEDADSFTDTMRDLDQMLDGEASGASLKEEEPLILATDLPQTIDDRELNFVPEEILRKEDDKLKELEDKYCISSPAKKDKRFKNKDKRKKSYPFL